MNKLIKSTLLTVVAGSFLMAAPTVAKKAQNTSAPASTAAQSTATKTKKAKKSKSTATGTAAPASTPQK